MNKIDLHIVCFDVPSPPNYGGVIDVYYRLKAIKELGYHLALHCFEYGRGESEELNQLAEKVYYYKRKNVWWSMLSAIPYIVKSRMNKDLLENLLDDHAPILFEGLHCSGFMNNDKLAGRNKWIRMHNVESHYYTALYKQTASFLKKGYYYFESKKIKKYEQELKGQEGVLCLSEQDKRYFEQFYKRVEYLAVFHEGDFVNVKDNSLGDYSLFQGNLKVEENEYSVQFLLKVFASSAHKLVIAGNEPSEALRKEVETYDNVTLIASPKSKEMNALIKKAKVNCLPSFQSTGVKLKLITALFNGQHVLVNNTMVTEEGLKRFCETAESLSQWKEKVDLLMRTNFSRDKFQIRKQELNLNYNNISNAKYLMELLAVVQ